MSEVQDQQPREVYVDDVAYVVAELPQQIQNLIATYDVWVQDRAKAQKEALQLDSAVRFLATQIQTAVRDHAASEAAEEAGEPVAEDDATAEAALDIPADGDEEA